MAPSTPLVCTTPEAAKGWPGCQESGLSQMFVLPAVPAFNVDVEGRWEVMRGRRCRPALTETTRAGSDVQGRVGISGRSVDAVSPAAWLLPRQTELPCIQVTSLPGPLDGNGGRLVYLGSSPVPALRSLLSALRLRRNDLTSHLSCSQAGAPSIAVPACCRPRASASQPRCCPCPHRVSSLPPIPMQSQCAPSAITADVSPPSAARNAQARWPPPLPSRATSHPRHPPLNLRHPPRLGGVCVPAWSASPCEKSAVALLHECLPHAPSPSIPSPLLVLYGYWLCCCPHSPSIPTYRPSPHAHTLLLVPSNRTPSCPASTSYYLVASAIGRVRVVLIPVRCTAECTLVSAGRTRAGVFLHSDR